MDHLYAHVVGDITDVETLVRLDRDGAVHQHLEQEIAELFTQCSRLEAVDCLEHLVGFLEQIRAKAAMRLLAIPGTSARRTQAFHNLVERAKRLDRLVTHGRSVPQPGPAAALVRAGRAREVPA